MSASIPVFSLLSVSLAKKDAKPFYKCVAMHSDIHNVKDEKKKNQNYQRFQSVVNNIVLLIVLFMSKLDTNIVSQVQFTARKVFVSFENV